MLSRWISTDFQWYRLAYSRRDLTSETLPRWTKEWDEPSGYFSPVVWRGEYLDAVTWQLREVFWDRLLHVSDDQHSVHQVSVRAEIKPTEKTADIQAEVTRAFKSVMGRFGSELDRVGEMSLEYAQDGAHGSVFTMNSVQFEWWRRAGLGDAEWMIYSQKPVESWEGARPIPWSSDGTPPPDSDWEQQVREIVQKAPNAEVLFLGWCNGGYLVAVFVPGEDTQEGTWASQLQTAIQLMGIRQVTDLRLISPEANSPRIARLTRDRYNLLTDGGHGNTLALSRFPSSHWPLLADWYWDSERP